MDNLLLIKASLLLTSNLIIKETHRPTQQMEPTQHTQQVELILMEPTLHLTLEIWHPLLTLEALKVLILITKELLICMVDTRKVVTLKEVFLKVVILKVATLKVVTLKVATPKVVTLKVATLKEVSPKVVIHKECPWDTNRRKKVSSGVFSAGGNRRPWVTASVQG